MTIIYITCKDEEEAVKISKHLLDKKLIACSNMHPIRSMYFWKGKIQDEKEVVIIAKTLEKNYGNQRYNLAVLNINGLTCPACIKIVKDSLKEIEGSIEVRTAPVLATTSLSVSDTQLPPMTGTRLSGGKPSYKPLLASALTTKNGTLTSKIPAKSLEFVEGQSYSRMIDSWVRPICRDEGIELSETEVARIRELMRLRNKAAHGVLDELPDGTSFQQLAADATAIVSKFLGVEKPKTPEYLDAAEAAGTGRSRGE